VEVAPNFWQEKHKEEEVRADTLLQNRKRWLPSNGRT
jgi:hypothetical protein